MTIIILRGNHSGVAMKVAGFTMFTALTTREVADQFRDFCGSSYTGAARMSGMLRRALGQMPDAQGVNFFTPRDTSPFAQLDDDPPAFSVGATIPKASGTGGGVVTLHIYVMDRQDYREVQVRAPVTVGNSSASNNRLEALRGHFGHVDPKAKFRNE